MLGSAGRRNRIERDGQDRSSRQDGIGRSQSVPSWLFETWQHVPQEHAGALQRQPTSTFQPPPAEVVLSMAVSSLPVPAIVNHTPEQCLREGI